MYIHFHILEEQAMDVRNEIKSHIVREGLSMHEIVAKLSVTHGWSSSISNFSGKLVRGTIKYSEVIELADAMGYDIVWVKRK